MAKDYGIDADNFSTQVAKKEFILLRDAALRKERTPSSVTVPLFDDGAAEHADKAAGDGVYSNLFGQTRVPGHYHFDFRLSGTAPVSGAFTRQQSMATTVRLKGVDAKNTLIRFERAAAGDSFLVTPIDSFGNHLGPGYGHLIRPSLDRGELVGKLVDNLDGTYRQGIRVDWNAPGSASLVILDTRIDTAVELTGGLRWWWWLLILLLLLVVVWVLRKLW
jgi:hypothetical protein